MKNVTILFIVVVLFISYGLPSFGQTALKPDNGHVVAGSVEVVIKATPRLIFEPTPMLYFSRLKCINKNSRIKSDSPYFKLDGRSINLPGHRSDATNGTDIYYEKSIAYPLQQGKTDWEVRLYEESDKYHLGTRKISSKDMGKGDKFGRFSKDTIPQPDNGNKSSYNSNPLDRDWNYELKYWVFMNAGGILVHSVTGGNVKVENVSAQLTSQQRQQTEIVPQMYQKVQKSPDMQLLWQDTGINSKMNINLYSLRGQYKLVTRMSTGPDAPIVQFVQVTDSEKNTTRPIGGQIDLYSPQVSHKKVFNVGTANFGQTGRHLMYVQVVGQNPKSKGRNVRFSSYEFSK